MLWHDIFFTNKQLLVIIYIIVLSVFKSPLRLFIYYCTGLILFIYMQFNAVLFYCI